MERNVPKLRFKEFNDEWKISKVGEITSKVGSGKTPKGGNSVYVSDGIMFIRSQNVLNGKLSLDDVVYISEEENDRMKSTQIKANDVLINITGASIGRCCKVPADFKNGNLNQHVCIIRPNKDNSEFIMNYMISDKIQKQIFSFQAGGNREGLNFEQIKGMTIGMPSIQEQERIANFLTKVDRIIEKQDEKVKKLENYKKGMMQKIFSQEIRFKDENGEEYPEWNKEHLGNLVERVVRKNKGNISNRPLTISAKYGLVDQEEFFNKVVASSNLEGYYLLENGEFAYNKSYSNGYPFGAIKRLDKYDDGAVSTLYICFKPKNGLSSDFLCHYFESDMWHKEVAMVAVEGARNHGLLNISVGDFFDTIHKVPCKKEQIQIANFLNNISNLLYKEENKFKELQKWKKALLQQMFV